jgi:hypothetical protein
MPYTSQYPKQFNAVMSFLNLSTNGDPSEEDVALYQWLDSLIDTCYEEAESYCGQPLRSGAVNYVFNADKGQVGIEVNHRTKFIPYNANTSLVSVQWRPNEFTPYQNVAATEYAWNAESFGNYLAYRGQSTGQYRLQLNNGFTDATMPKTIMQGISEMVALIYRLSPVGGNWFGLNSIASGGAGQTVNASLKTDIGWQKYFGIYHIPTV